MTPFSSLSPKIKLLFFIVCSAFINESFAEDLIWKGGLDCSPKEQTDLQKRTEPLVEFLNETTCKDFFYGKNGSASGEANNYLNDKSCFEPKLHKDFDCQDRIIFSNETLLDKIECTKLNGSSTHAGNLVFRDDKQFTVNVSNQNTLSLHYENGIINEGSQAVHLNVIEQSTLNILGKPVYGMNLNSCSNSPIHFDVKDDSHLHFEGVASGQGAKVELHDNSRLTIITSNPANSLNALNTSPSSSVVLNGSYLTLGNSGASDTLNGTLSGDKSSFLIKKGGGKMSLGDSHSFEGTIIVNDGSVVLKKDLGGNVEIAGNSKTIFEFHDQASAASHHINVNQGKVYFKNNSSADNAKINLVNGELNFQNDSKGNQASVGLSGSKLIIGQNNTLGSLNADETSIIDLNAYALKIGSLNQNDQFKGGISGSNTSKIIKEGTGSLSLYGKNNSFNGDMEINGGKVILSDSHLGGSLIVNQACTLSGSGSIAKNLINNDGVIDLNEKDTLKISGHFMQSENSACLLKLNKKGQNSKIEVKGTGTLNNSPLHLSGDVRLCSPYVVFEAEKIEGDFEINSENLQLPSLVELVVNQEHADKKEKTTLRFVPNLLGGELSSNQQNIGAQLKNINNLDGNHDNSLQALVELNEDDVPRALDRLSGAQYSHLILANERSTGQFIRRIYTPLRSISIDHDCEELCMNKCITWFDFEAGKTFQKGKHGYDMVEYNVTAAIQKSMNDWLTESCPLSGIIPCTWLTGWTAGLAGSYSHQNYDFDLGGEAHLHETKLAIYTLLTRPLYYIVLDFIAGSTTGKLERSIKCGRINEKAHSTINLCQATFYGELGLNNIFVCDTLRIQPFIGIETGYYSLGRCKEHGTDLFDLEIQKHSECLTTSYLGLHFFNFQNDDCSWGISADIIWKHLFEFDNHLEKKFCHFGDKFKICGHQQGLNGMEGTLTYFKRISDCWLINADISGEIWENYTNFYLSVGFSYKW
ncbi:MAG: autotransporter domain-containing protein [Candidatus Protochlamydia sp.]|nr:autotransporter domain-containing protein [Candidatus Protochlamydia sp.]